MTKTTTFELTPIIVGMFDTMTAITSMTNGQTGLADNTLTTDGDSFFRGPIATQLTLETVLFTSD